MVYFKNAWIMKKLKCILLIDDDRTTVYLCDKLLKKMGIAEKVELSSNGEDGLKSLIKCYQEDCTPEIILLDLNMPVMNGFEFLEHYNELKLKHKEGTKIVVFTSSKHEKDVSRIKELGITNYINKPLSEEKMLQALAA